MTASGLSMRRLPLAGLMYCLLSKPILNPLLIPCKMYSTYALSGWSDSSAAHTLACNNEWISDEITKHERSSTGLQISKANKWSK